MKPISVFSRRSAFQRRVFKNLARFALLLGLAFGAAGSTQASTVTWNIGSGDWAASGAWTPSAPSTTGTATINNGGTITFSNTDTGTVDRLYVGDTGTGTMIFNGGLLQTTRTYLGDIAGSSGTLAMNSGTLNATDYFIIGYRGTGYLNQSGGLISSTNIFIGMYVSNSSGTATITGGTLAASSIIGIGEGGPGIVNVNGGTVDVSSGSLSIGRYAAGALNLSSGQVKSSMGYIGELSGGSGTASISGGTWTNTGLLYVGYQAAGVMSLTDSGTVSVGATAGSGTVVIGSNSTLNVGTGGTAGTLLAAKVTGSSSTATVNFYLTNSITFSPVLTGTLGVNKLGSGTATLTAVNTFTGLTTVSAGRLNINGALSTSGSVNLKSGATLGGSGTVGHITSTGGAVAVDSGTLSATSLSMDAATSLQLQISGTNGGASGQLKISSSITLAGTLALTGLDSLTPLSSITLIEATGPGVVTTGSFAAVTISGTSVLLTTSGGESATFTSDNKEYQIDYNAGDDKNNVLLTLVSLPEPATWAILLSGMGLLALLRNRKA